MTAIVNARPYLPDNDDFVLAVLPFKPSQSGPSDIDRLKQNLKSDPKNRLVAIELAKRYLEMAKQTSDPRYYGLAETVIKPWWNDSADLDLMMLKANVLEFDHKFLEALTVLNNVIKIHNHSQAILMRANINQIIGRYDLVKRDCTQLISDTSALIVASCLFSVDGFTSGPESTKTLISKLRDLLAISNVKNVEVQLWSLGLLAETASLNGYWPLAEELLITGLDIKQDDTYLLSLYADLLLKQARFQDTVDLLQPFIEQTSLLVRFLVANSQMLATTTYRVQQKNLDMRIREDEIKGDQRHLREYAYYQLYVKHNKEIALQNALINWENQKELIDSLILYRAAFDLNRLDVLQMLAVWRDDNNVKIDFAAQSLKI